jgi:phosphatidylserine synthase 2
MHDATTARDMVHAIFPDVGRPLPEKDYAADCRLYTPENPVSSFNNFREAFWDAHTLAHLLGWWVKMLILRDWKLCFFLSVFFEWIEITFRYHLKNFWECWWDHLILDIFGCNLCGIILGYYTCKMFEFKKYYITTSPQIIE